MFGTAKKGLSALRNVGPGFTEPMYATAVRELPDGDPWAYGPHANLGNASR